MWRHYPRTFQSFFYKGRWPKVRYRSITDPCRKSHRTKFTLWSQKLFVALKRPRVVRGTKVTIIDGSPAGRRLCRVKALTRSFFFEVIFCKTCDWYSCRTSLQKTKTYSSSLKSLDQKLTLIHRKTDSRNAGFPQTEIPASTLSTLRTLSVYYV